MKNSYIFILILGILALAPLNVSASTEEEKIKRVVTEESMKERSHRIREYREEQSQVKIDRELKKKRLAQWKRERAQLMKEYKQGRSEYLQKIEAERENEIASRARQKEIRAQMDMEEAQYKADLEQKRSDIMYGNLEEDELDEEDGAEKKKRSIWDKLMVLKDD